MKVINNGLANGAKKFLWGLVGIATIYILSVIIVNPTGNFPLNDDWSFGLTVQRLVEKGYYEPGGWAAMPLISNVILGWIFSIPLGFSFEALRISTLTVSLIGLFYFYWLIQSLSKSHRLGIFSALVLAFCPIYFALSHTFMTDVPFTAFLIICSVHLWRYLQFKRNSDLFAGTIVSVIATLSRQLGLAVPIAFAITSIWIDFRRGLMSRTGIIKAFLPAFSSFTALKLFECWLQINEIMPILYKSKSNELASNLSNPKLAIGIIAFNGFSALAYLGFFLFPILAVAAFRLSILKRLRFSICIFGGVAVMMVLFSRRSFSLMPYMGNILDISGIGPLTLRDASFLGRMNVSQLPFWFWLTITTISIIGGSLLLGVVGFCIFSVLRSHSSRSKELSPTSFFWLASLIYLAPLLLAFTFDRYLIPVLPLATAAILSQPELFGESNLTRPFRIGALSWILVLSYAAFSITSTHDYLSWNRARWFAIDSLSKDRQALSRQTDGGFEFNGYYGYDPRYISSQLHSWWWVKSDKYMIAFGPVRGWKIIRSIPYQHFLPSMNGSIYVLEK